MAGAVDNHIRGLTLTPDGRLLFQFPGVAGRSYVVEASTQLPVWQAIATNTAPVRFSTPLESPPPYRYFRLRSMP